MMRCPAWRRSAPMASNISLWECQPTMPTSSGADSIIALRRQPGDCNIAAALRRGVAEQRRQQHRPLEIEADVVLVGEADGAVKLDAGLGDDQRVFRRLGLHGD